MNRIARCILWPVLTLTMTVTPSRTQSVRSLVNGGNDLYDAGKYADAEVEYRKSLEKNNTHLEGTFNLGDALFKQNHFDEAIREYRNPLAKTDDPTRQAELNHKSGHP